MVSTAVDAPLCTEILPWLTSAHNKMTPMLDTKRIRISTPAQLRDYYTDLVNSNSVVSITTQLLQAVERGAVPPLTFAPWLGVSKSPKVIREALTQNKSVLVRKLAIKQLELGLCSSRWKETWGGIGGTAGVLHIFKDLSVLEIRQACEAIGRCAKGKDLNEKRACYTELFKGLHPSAFPDALFKTTDRRPLSKYYGLLVPACSEESIEEATSMNMKGVWRHARARGLFRNHPESMRRKYLQYLDGEHTKAFNEQDLKSLIKQFPSVNTPERGFSATMEFSRTILRTLAKSESSQMDDNFFINELIRPLLKRAVKRHAKWENVLEIVHLTMQYMEAHPTAGKEITHTVDDVSHLIAQCWSRRPQLFETQLRRLCSHPLFGTSSLERLQDWDSFLQRISPGRRYSLLRLVLQESTGLDLNVDADLKRIKGSLSYELLNSLGPEQALSLSSRLRKARGDEDLVEPGNSNSVLYVASTHGGHNGDPDIYEIVLQHSSGNEEEAQKLATIYLQDRKKKAASASQPEDRGFHARSALFAAIGSGSLVIYQETIEWTKRFLRDPRTIREMYPRFYPKESSRLLSGAPEPLGSQFSMSELRHRVEKANAILLNMFEMACTALCEPSFSSGDWEGTFNLFSTVIQDRINLSPTIKNIYKASYEDVYHSLWEPTIPMLISIEEKANQEDFERLGANSLRGILGCMARSMIELESKDMSTVTFFDNLAKSRDELWVKLRSRLYPITAALPTPFPRGLPIQYLTAPWNINMENLGGCAPYLASRVQATLFPDPAAALLSVPTEGDWHKAIGVFVDSYPYALQLHIPSSIQKAEKEKRVKKVWDFAISSLSQSRMDGEEAVRFWSCQKPEYLKEWPPQELALENCATWPLIPETANPLEPCEWNPFTSGRPNFRKRDLGKLTYIDLSLAVLEQTRFQPTVHHKLESVPPQVPGLEVSAHTMWNSSRKMGEGGVLSALLYLDTRYVSDNHLLEGPFPTEYEPRYPVLYLDDEFLSSDIPNPFTAVRSIRGHLNSIPPPMLAQLVQSVVRALDATDEDSSTYQTIHEVVMTLIVRLGESDRPDLATEVAIRTVLHKPKSSSWHRSLLKPSLFRRLAASDAQACFKEFAYQIFDKLQARDGEAEVSGERESDSGSGLRPRETAEQYTSKPFVKVTTQKFLAQLLEGTEFVDEDYALSILSSLYQMTSHIDVHLNLVKALLSMLKFGSSSYSNDILAVLERTLHLAGSLNEREPLTEMDWAQSEETLLLPQIQEDVSNISSSSSPILAALMSHFRNAPNDIKQLQAFVDRIILPTVLRFKQQTNRWIALFLRKYGIENTAQRELKIPLIPRDFSVSLLLLSADNTRVRYLPRTVLEEYVTYITFNIAPSASIRQLNRRLLEDPALKSQNDVKTWLGLYGRGLEVVKHVRIFELPSKLGIDVLSTMHAAITPRLVQEQFLRLFTAVLWNDTPTYTLLEDYLTHRFSKGDYLIQPWWHPHGKAIVKAMVAYVNTIRTSDWERNPKRKPFVLPDTFPWRLLLLDYPWPDRCDKIKDRERKCEAFANQLKSIIDEISGSLCGKSLSQLKSYLSLDPVSSKSVDRAEKKIGRCTIFYGKRDPLHDALIHNRGLTAIYLGSITKTRLSSVTASELLRVEVASYLVEMVEDFDDIDKVLKEKLKQLLDSWKSCENEDVRRMGWTLKERCFPDSG
ncbi:uncharacterized protein K460DRAFT_353745 [Cucurbitaria berberidis CBS 394.84]|uniref:Uncharacterized protein n=1 Tax=Cucurbitaria berberidis CBS 394.84 TaxID=1168544 RepID=A0A9P4GP17_9PLEO|nr:uncharacterized protein K460DRAFT_353745 [Cucurbitaria berberidis CBS 394.84]KAF1848806.1 hypothetical protein K460DRAFT_353745 [Cucurbitaria berberidis CBS 394.84]